MHRRRFLIGSVALMTLLFSLTGCGQGAPTTTDGKLTVTTTTGMIGDVVKRVGGEHVSVTSLMGPGVDPHLYRASEGDVSKLSRAQVIFYNGLDLEGKMGNTLERLAKDRPVVPVGDVIPVELLMVEEAGIVDPHIWFDVTLWMRVTERIKDQLIETDPANREAYEQRAGAYLTELADVHQYAQEQIAQIPKERRVLVTAHDAFGYFGRTYDIEVMALQGLSTDAEYGLADVQNLVSVLVERQIKAVFVESSIPVRSIEAVVQGAKARGHAVVVGGELFSDAMGAEGSPEGTYVGMVRHNVDTIVSALK